MFQRKRSKIAAYLQTSPPSPFALLLSDWYSGQMQERLSALGLVKLDCHIDWLPDYKCINIQGRYGKQYVDIQIEGDAFFIAADAVEPDEPEEFPLESADRFYLALRSFLESNRYLRIT